MTIRVFRNVWVLRMNIAAYLFSNSMLMVGHSTLLSCVLSRLRAVLAMDVMKAAASGLAIPLTVFISIWMQSTETQDSPPKQRPFSSATNTPLTPSLLALHDDD